MRSKTFVSLWLVLAMATAAAALSGEGFKQHQGTVLADTMVWKASGSILGSYVNVDTIVAGTLNDTTKGYPIAGAEYVSIQIRSVSKNDDSDYTITPQISADNGTHWCDLATTFSVDNTAGAEVGGSDSTGFNDLWCVVKYPVVGDTLATASANATSDDTQRITLTHSDNIYVGAARFLRLRIDPDSASGDTTFVSAIITRVYPAR